ncbi:hypothetical protein INT45_009633 [Circinella minor]|uniref:F-box domain-containing protein n=1 Tax=Circinella minor TaxID=1195481 RepID=A0A8H7VM69_9FUNG|nr:hypothetical protein INT45_009633 [Circinella minor]
MDHQMNEFRNAANQLVQQIVYINNDNEFKSYSTTILDILGDIQQSIYMALAVRYSVRHDFSQTINDDAVAKTTMTIKDTTITNETELSLQNYLIIGEVLIFKARYKDAIITYEKGLQVLLPSEWPLLYMKRQEAKEAMDRKRIDFITRLPLEITAYIFDYLVAILKKKEDAREFDLTLVECTYVSHSWRAILLEQEYVAKKLWTTAVLSGAGGLTINSTEQQVKSVNELAYAKRLPYLKELIFLLHNESNGMTSIKQCKSLISRCCNNLVSLEIEINFRWYQENDSPLCLATVLATCQNLKELTVVSESTNVSFNWDNSLIDSDTAFSLTSLATSITIYDNTIPLLDKLIPYCPHLKILMTSNASPTVLNLLDYHCPRLEYLYINSSSNISNFWRPSFQDLVSTSNNSSDNNCINLATSSSLQSIDIDQQNITSEYAESLLRLLLKGQHTIKHINYSVPYGFRYLWNILNNQLRLGPNELLIQLTTLNISYRYNDLSRQRDARRIRGGEFIDSIADFIIQHCRSLDRLSLILTNTFSESFYLSLATHLPKLSDFVIQAPIHQSGCTGLQEFFEHHANLEYKSTLRTFCLRRGYEVGFVNDALLLALGDIIALEKITLFGPFEKCTRKGIRTFLRKLARSTGFFQIICAEVN